MNLIVSFFDGIIIKPLSIIIQSIARALPAVLLCAVWIVLATLIATILENLTRKFLQAVKFNRMAERIQLHRILPSFAPDKDYSRGISVVLYWFVFALLLLSAISALDLAPITLLISRFILYIPNILIALIIIIAGWLGSRWLKLHVSQSDKLKDSATGRLLAGIACPVLIIFAIITAIYELNIAQTLILMLYRFLFATIALALGIAFGLGGKDIAQGILNEMTSRKDQG